MPHRSARPSHGRPVSPDSPRATRWVAVTGLIVLTGCSGAAPREAATGTTPLRAESLSVAPGDVPTTEQARPPAEVPVGQLTARKRPDVLVTTAQTISPTDVQALVRLSKDGGALAFRAGNVRLGGKPVKALGVDPSQFRAYAAEGTAEATAVWQAVARGEAVASHEAAKALGLQLGKDVALAPAADGTPRSVRLGAFATTGIPGSDLIVDDETANALGLPAATAVLLTAGKGQDPVALASQVRKVTGTVAEVDLLTAPAANPVAFLTGSKAAKAFGAFSYKYFPDGTIAPDARWVRENIRTETLPVMGRVTCHRLMLVQLRGALEDVEQAGLGSTLKTYDGCYVPRFIERNPENSISLHTWGIAIDMDAATNYRGIRGTMHPEVVNIFKRWGFRWGGDWKYTDPMHFELSALLDSPR